MGKSTQEGTVRSIFRKIKKRLNAQVPDMLHPSMGVATGAAALAEQSPWLGEQEGVPQGQPDFYLALTIKEARGLIICDSVLRSSDPYVAVSIVSKRGTNAGVNQSRHFYGDDNVPLAQGEPRSLQARTRICHRNRNPLFEQCLLFPLRGLQSDAIVKLAVYDDNVLASEFMGSASIELGDLLSSVTGLSEETEQWVALSYKNFASGDKTGGEVLYSATVVDAEGFAMLGKEVVEMLDPASLHTKLGDLMLTVQMHGIRRLRGLPSFLDKSGQSLLNYEVRVGKDVVSRPIIIKGQDESSVHSNVSASSATVAASGGIMIDDEVVLDLANCFNDLPATRNKKRINEVGDVRIRIKAGKETLFKTQVPIWDVPILMSSEELDELARGASLDSASSVDDETESVASPDHANGSGSAFCPIARAVHRQIKWFYPQAEAWCNGEKSGAGEAVIAAARMSSDTLGSPSSTGAASLPMTSSIVTTNTTIVSTTSTTTTPLLTTASYTPSQATTVNSDPSSHHTNGSSDSPSFHRSQAIIPESPVVSHPHVPFMRSKGGKMHGKRYTRPMEPYSNSLRDLITLTAHNQLAHQMSQQGMMGGNKDAESFVDLDVTMSMEPRPHLAAQPEGVAAPVEDSQEDVESPAPVTLPAPLETLLLDGPVNAGVNKLFTMMWAADSKFMEDMFKEENLTKATATPWAVDATTKVRTRTITYIKPLKIPLPMAPKEALCTVVQTVLVKEDGGWTVESKVTSNAPKGDCFYVMIQNAATHTGLGKCRLKSTMHVEFTSGVGFLKNTIISGAEKDSKRYQEAVYAALKRTLGDAGGDAGSAGAGSDMAAGATAVGGGGGTAMSAEDVAHAKMLQLVQLGLLAALVLSVLWLAWAVSRAGGRISAGLTQLATATRENGAILRSATGARVHGGSSGDNVTTLLMSAL